LILTLTYGLLGGWEVIRLLLALRTMDRQDEWIGPWESSWGYWYFGVAALAVISAVGTFYRRPRFRDALLLCLTLAAVVDCYANYVDITNFVSRTNWIPRGTVFSEIKYATPIVWLAFLSANYWYLLGSRTREFFKNSRLGD